MSIYKYNSSDNTLTLAERNIYGSSRLGLEEVDQEMLYEQSELLHTLDFNSINIDNANSGVCSTAGTLTFNEYNLPSPYEFNYSIDPIAETIEFNNAENPTNTALATGGFTSSYSLHMTVNTIPGANYTVSFDVSNYSGGNAVAYMVECPSAGINFVSVPYNSDGTYSFTYTASSTQSRIKWFNPSGSPTILSSTTLSNIVVTWPGDVFGTNSQTQPPSEYLIANYKGDKRYELSNHLGNVLTVVTDRKLPQEGTGVNAGTVDFYTADVVAFNDYYPFGMVMPGRNGGEDFRFGFQGQESDDEVKEQKGTSINYKYRMHDPRIGRFFSVDPLTPKYPHNSPYAFSENMVIHAVELEGLEASLGTVKDDNGKVVGLELTIQAQVLNNTSYTNEEIMGMVNSGELIIEKEFEGNVDQFGGDLPLSTSFDATSIAEDELPSAQFLITFEEFTPEEISLLEQGKKTNLGHSATGSAPAANITIKILPKDYKGPLVDESVDKTVAHETGHAIGLGHSDEQDNLMYEDDSGGTDINHEQLNKVTKTVKTNQFNKDVNKDLKSFKKETKSKG